MKRMIVLAAVLVFLVPAASTSAGGGPSEKPKVACWDVPEGVGPVFKTAPRKCQMFKRGAEGAAEGLVSVLRMNWKWGQRRAKGKGKAAISTAGLFAVRVRLTKPVSKCGRVVFSKLKATYEGPGDDRFKVKFRLNTC